MNIKLLYSRMVRYARRKCIKIFGAKCLFKSGKICIKIDDMKIMKLYVGVKIATENKKERKRFFSFFFKIKRIMLAIFSYTYKSWVIILYGWFVKYRMGKTLMSKEKLYRLDNKEERLK